MSKSIYEEALKESKDFGSFVGLKLDKVNNALEKAEKQEKLLELYKQAYDNANAEVLKMFTYEQDEKTTLTNIIGHLDNSETVVQIRELEKEE